MISSQLKAVVQAFDALPVADREAFDQMRPDRKVFKADEEDRAKLDLVYANAEEKAANQRKLTGLARNAATQNTNEQKHFQITDSKLNALDGGQIELHRRLDGLTTIVEMESQDTAQWRGHIMEILLEIQELLKGS